MSWAAHNPEAYDEICRQGIMDKIIQQFGVCPSLEDIVAFLYDQPKIASVLVDWAFDEINNQEADYWGMQIDNAVNTKEGSDATD